MACLFRASAVQSPILATQTRVSLFKRKDVCHRKAHPESEIRQQENAMRMFERLRLNFGFLPVEVQKDAKARREQADVAVATPYVPVAESTCCGHCSGNTEAHILELPTAR